MSKRIQLIVIAHFVAGITFCVWSAVECRVPFVLELILFVPACAVVLCQSCLLALWAAMSHAAIWRRIAGLIAGTIFLEVLLRLALGGDALVFLTTIATGIVVVALLVLRRWKTQLLRFLGQPPWGNAEGLQFSIRGLIGSLLVVRSCGYRLVENQIDSA